MYFDAAATTPLLPEVQRAMQKAQSLFGNMHSHHREGFRAKKAYETYMQTIAQKLGVSTGQLTISHGGTDANRRIFWLLSKLFGKENIYCTGVEHSSIADEINEENYFDPVTFAELENKNPKAIWIMDSNNETGLIYDISKLKEKFPNAIIVSDWVQSLGKREFDTTNCDMLVMSAHKIHGPKGIGLIYIKEPEKYLELSKDTHTKDLTGIAGMAEAFTALSPQTSQKLQTWQSQIEAFITTKIDNFKIHGADQKRVPGIINVAFGGVRGSELMSLLSEEEGICISTGSACTSDMMAPSRIIQWMNPAPEYLFPIRISLHRMLTDQDIVDFCEALKHYVEVLRKRR